MYKIKKNKTVSVTDSAFKYHSCCCDRRLLQQTTVLLCIINRGPQTTNPGHWRLLTHWWMFCRRAFWQEMGAGNGGASFEMVTCYIFYMFFLMVNICGTWKKSLSVWLSLCFSHTHTHLILFLIREHLRVTTLHRVWRRVGSGLKISACLSDNWPSLLMFLSVWLNSRRVMCWLSRFMGWYLLTEAETAKESTKEHN